MNRKWASWRLPAHQSNAWRCFWPHTHLNLSPTHKITRKLQLSCSTVQCLEKEPFALLWVTDTTGTTQCSEWRQDSCCRAWPVLLAASSPSSHTSSLAVNMKILHLRQSFLLLFIFIWFKTTRLKLVNYSYASTKHGGEKQPWKRLYW